jgi:hypothetical protein
MADLTYKVTVDTTQAEKNLNNLNKQFGMMKSALAGLAIGSFVAGAYRSAQAAKDLSEQTGLAVQSVLGLRQAFQANASSAEAADTAMLRITRSISEAQNGNDALAKSFNEIGISLDEFTGKADEDVLRVIEGLGSVKNQADQTRLAFDIAGKGGAGFYAGIASSAKGYISSNYDAAQATIKANAAAEKFDETITQLKNQILIALTPLNDFVKNINVSSEAIKEFVKVIGTLLLVVGTFTAIGRAGSLITGTFKTIRLAGKSLATTIEVLTHYWKRFTGAIDVAKPKNSLIGGITKSIGYAITAISSLLGALGTLAAFIIPDTVLEGFKKLGQLIGVLPDEITETANYIDELNAKATEDWMKQTEEVEKNTQALRDKVNAINDIGNAYKDANAQILQNIDNEIKYIGMTDREAEAARAIDGVYENQSETLKKLAQEFIKLPEGETERRNAILETIKVVNADTEATINGINEKLKALQLEREAIEERNRAIEFGETIRQDTAALQAMQDEIDMLYMSAEQREIYQKKLANERTLKERLASIDREAAQIGKNATDSQIADFERRRQAAISYYNSVNELNSQNQMATEDQTRQIQVWAEDTRDALEESISPANNVRNFWEGLSGQIDNFVKTGKFSIKQFLASMIQDFIAAKLKLAALKLFENIFGGGTGLFGGKIIPGLLAEGGPAQAGKPYIVGEKGPELFVPQNSGTVVPNNKLNGTATAEGKGTISAPVTNNYITNNISAIDARSVAQLFAENRKTLLGSVIMAQKEMPYATNMV